VKNSGGEGKRAYISGGGGGGVKNRGAVSPGEGATGLNEDLFGSFLEL